MIGLTSAACPMKEIKLNFFSFSSVDPAIGDLFFSLFYKTAHMSSGGGLRTGGRKAEAIDEAGSQSEMELMHL